MSESPDTPRPSPDDPDLGFVVTPPPLLASLHGELARSVGRELALRYPSDDLGVAGADGGNIGPAGFDGRKVIEKLSREVLDLLAEQIGPGAVPWMTERAPAELVRRYPGEGLLRLVDNMIHVWLEAPKGGASAPSDDGA